MSRKQIEDVSRFALGLFAAGFTSFHCFGCLSLRKTWSKFPKANLFPRNIPPGR